MSVDRYQMASRLRFETVLRSAQDQFSMARQFTVVARAMAREDALGNMRLAQRLTRECGLAGAVAFAKAVVSGQTTAADVWQSGPGRELADAYIASLAEGSVLDLLLRYGRPIPSGLTQVLMASGTSASSPEEGQAKLVANTILSGVDVNRRKAAALIVLSDELDRATGGAINQLFENELKAAVLSATNTAALALFNSTAIAGSGSVTTDLAVGLAAAGSARNYIVVAVPEAMVELALAADGRLGVDGGEYVPGVHVVRGEETSSATPKLRIIAADKTAAIDHGLQVKNANHASVEMSDSPTNDSGTPTASTLVSLFQTNSAAVLVERHFAIATDARLVEVG